MCTGKIWEAKMSKTCHDCAKHQTLIPNISVTDDDIHTIEKLLDRPQFLPRFTKISKLW